MTFAESKKLGKIGEAIAARKMRAQGWRLRDVSEDTRYQQYDIDFIACCPMGLKNIEIKTDLEAPTTHNLFFEYSNKGNAGWLLYSRTDYIGFLVDNVLHLASFREVYDYLYSHRHTMRRVGAVDGNSGYLLPIDEFAKFKSYLCM